MESIQYRLIPYSNQKGEWLIVSDEEIKAGDSILHPDGYIKKNIHLVDAQSDKRDNCKMIIASSKFINKSIALIRKEQCDYCKVIQFNGYDILKAHLDGFNAVTDNFDYLSFVDHGIFNIPKSHAANMKFIDDLRESLIKKEYIVELEIDQIGICCSPKDNVEIYPLNCKIACANYTETNIPKIDKEGYITILSLK